MGRLEGKVAIVTGAGSGIGEATVRLMAQEGASVVAADIDGQAAQRVAGEVTGAVAVEADVSDESSVIRMVEAAVESFGGLDVLHNNASDAATNQHGVVGRSSARRRSRASSGVAFVPPTARRRQASCS